MRPRCSWRLTWRREGWTQSQTRHFEVEHAALRKLAVLQRGDRPDLAPLIELHIDVREVGPWHRGPDEATW